MVEQAQAFVEHAREAGISAGVVVRDRDCKYIRAFDNVLKGAGIDVHPLSFRSPNLNAFIERFVQSIQQECLDKFIVFGQEHLDYIANQYLRHYHEERPHQAMGNRTLKYRGSDDEPSADGEIVCNERLGGVLKHYYRQAA